MSSRVFLRNLQKKDAPLMLEWMHDADIQRGFKKNMLDMKLEDAEHFCQQFGVSEQSEQSGCYHFAIVDKNDEYLGTVSLKNMDLQNGSAEYAIVLRKKAQGKGIGTTATREILKKAFFYYGLNRVYLSVRADNVQAIKMYEKNGFVFEGEFREHLRINDKYINWKWYGILKNEYVCEYKKMRERKVD